MNIFISSISSYVGYSTALYLHSAGHTIIGSYRTYTKRIESLENLENVTILRIDHSISSCIPTLNFEIDVLINSTGAFLSHNVTKEDILNANTKTALMMSKYIEESKAPKMLINFSTLSIYGDLRLEQINSTTPRAPADLYGSTKLLAEQILDQVSQYLPVVHIRFPVVLGKGAHRAWLPTLLYKFKSNQDIVLYNSSSPYNCCTTLYSVNQFVYSLLSKSMSNYSYACNLGAYGDITIAEIIEKIKNNVNSSSEVLYLQNNLPCCMIDTNEASELGYIVPYTSDCIDYWLSEASI